jgi:hypothetical protein
VTSAAICLLRYLRTLSAGDLQAPDGRRTRIKVMSITFTVHNDGDSSDRA